MFVLEYNISVFGLGEGEGGSWMALKKSTPGDIWNPGLPCSRKDVAGHGKLHRHDAKEEDEYDSELELRSSRFWDILYKIWLLSIAKIKAFGWTWKLMIFRCWTTSVECGDVPKVSTARSLLPQDTWWFHFEWSLRSLECGVQTFVRSTNDSKRKPLGMDCNQCAYQLQILVVWAKFGTDLLVTLSD